MAVNFTPDLKPYKETGSFRFWCQKVLPLVYDDSLSYYELLCKVVNYLNDVIQNIDGLHDDVVALQNAFNELQNYVNNYFDNLDVQEEINNKLDQMVEDGVFDTIFKNIVLNLSFNPDQTKKERYQTFICQSLVSYLVRNYGSDCIASGTPIDNIVFAYHNLWDYMGLFGIGTFHKNETIVINGVTKNIIYLDCSTFTSLNLRGRDFPNSVYFQIFNNNVLDDDTLTQYAVENPAYNMDFTIDWFNNLQTSRDAFIMENSGNNLKVLWNATPQEGTLNNVFASDLETGDLLFFGRSGLVSQNKYMGIYHCGIYIKSLEDLNQYANTFNITLQALPSSSADDLGYIVEMSNPTDETIYKNCLSIRKLRDYTTLATAENNWYRIFVSKPNSNSLNSNKYMREIIGRDNLYKFQNSYSPAADYNNKIHYNLSRGSIDARSIGSEGMQIPEGSDVRALDIGVWRCTDLSNLPTIINIPYNTTYFTLEKTGAVINGGFYGNMVFKTISQTYANIEICSCFNNNWSEWKRLNGTENGIVNFNVNANSVETKAVQFTQPFDYEPAVNAIINSKAKYPGLGSVSVGVADITQTGFNLTLFNNSSSQFNVNVLWMTH